MFERRSALAPYLAAGGRDGADGARTLRLSEVRGWHLLQLAAFDRRGTHFGDALAPLIGADLPAAAGQQRGCDHGRILCLSRGQYWVDSHDAAWLADLSRAIPPEAGAATPLSHGRIRLAIDGAKARALLAKGIAVDLRPSVFRVGDFAQTALHHTGILLEQRAESRYELFALRTYSASIWEWMIDAALPFGYDVGVEDIGDKK